MSRLIWIGLVLLITVSLGEGPLTRAEEFIELDTVINITSQAGAGVITTQQAEEAVAKANEILKKAKIKLKVVRVNGPTSQGAQGGNADGDSSFDSEERKKAREEGGKELDGVVGAGKGIKITFGDTVKEGSGTPGISVHHNRCAICKNRPTSQLSGETIAHEVGHILTLCGTYPITATTSADAAGHAADNDNFMAPSNRRTGTNVTTMQAEEMRKKATTLGTTVTQPATSQPAVPVPHGSGGKQDERDDALNPAAPAGLNYNQAYHRHGDVNMELFFTLENVLDPIVPMTWRYLWLWDIDSNPGTGVNILGTPGVERGVHIQINTGGGTINSTVQFQSFGPGPNFPLEPATFVAEIEPDDDNPPVPTESSILVRAPYSAFNFVSPTPQMYLLSIDPFANQAVDRIETNFIVDFDADKPQLALFPPIANPGDSVLFSGNGFTPFTTARLYLDDVLIPPPFLVDPIGNVGGSFVVPITMQPVTGNFYFVTVLDDQNRSGFNVINLQPCKKGDLNNDGAVNFLDIDAFVAALLNAPNLDAGVLCAADINGDGAVNGLDIEPFIALLGT